MGAVLNAADEIAVSSFLCGKLSFLGISETVEQVYDKMSFAKSYTRLDDILSADKEARSLAKAIIDK